MIFSTVARAIQGQSAIRVKVIDFAGLQIKRPLNIMNDGTTCHGAKGRIVLVAGFDKRSIASTREQIAGLLVRVTADRVDASVGARAKVEDTQVSICSTMTCRTSKPIPAPSSRLIGIPSHDAL